MTEVMDGVKFVSDEELTLDLLFEAVAKEQAKACEVLNMQRDLDEYSADTGDDSKKLNDAIGRYIFDANDLFYLEYYDSSAFDRLYEAWKETDDNGKITFIRVFDILQDDTLREYLKSCLNALNDGEQIKNREFVKTVYAGKIKNNPTYEIFLKTRKEN